MNHASKTNRIVPSLFTTTQILKGQPMKTSIADRSPQSLKGILLLALALIFLSTAPARADLVWTVTSVDADETAVLTITTDGTSHTVDGTYNLLSIDKVEYCSGGGCTPVTVIDWDDEFGAEPPPFYQILGAGPIQVTGSVPSLL
ncbi:MAG: hypothetical protein GY869_13505, partial [Planctomycetes bacterium]|nr:hypothetical protein [Planctomycetota bacterium]